MSCSKPSQRGDSSNAGILLGRHLLTCKITGLTMNKNIDDGNLRAKFNSNIGHHLLIHVQILYVHRPVEIAVGNLPSNQFFNWSLLRFGWCLWIETQALTLTWKLMVWMSISKYAEIPSGSFKNWRVEGQLFICKWFIYQCKNVFVYIYICIYVFSHIVHSYSITFSKVTVWSVCNIPRWKSV